MLPKLQTSGDPRAAEIPTPPGGKGTDRSEHNQETQKKKEEKTSIKRR